MNALAPSFICQRLGCSLPIVLAGMGGVARSDLVNAVFRAGGFGFLGMVREPPELIVREVERLRASGQHSFGVNIIPAATAPELLERQVACCLELAVPTMGLFWDIDVDLIARLRGAGVLVVQQVGSVKEAVEAQSAGADIVIAQGREAGGHVRGTEPLATLLPRIVDAVELPVLAAGGMARGSDLVTALALGAHAIVLGTAFIATREAFAHPYHKDRLLKATSGDTILTNAFHINWPPAAAVRVLKSEVTDGRQGDPFTRERVIVGEEDGRPIYLFSTDSPLQSTRGDLERMALYCGTGVNEIGEIVGAGDRVAAIMEEAKVLLSAGSSVVQDHPENSSPVCYAYEISGAYMGHLDTDEVTAECAVLAKDLFALLQRAIEQPSGHEGPAFTARVANYSRWYLILCDLSKKTWPLQSSQSENASPASLLKRIGLLVPRVSDPAYRKTLTGLATFLEAERIVELRGSTSPHLVT